MVNGQSPLLSDLHSHHTSTLSSSALYRHYWTSCGPQCHSPEVAPQRHPVQSGATPTPASGEPGADMLATPTAHWPLPNRLRHSRGLKPPPVPTAVTVRTTPGLSHLSPRLPCSGISGTSSIFVNKRMGEYNMGLDGIGPQTPCFAKYNVKQRIITVLYLIRKLF